MLNDFNLVNNEMNMDTKVLEVHIEPKYTMPCGCIDDDVITLWSDDALEILNVLYNNVLRDYLMMVYDIEESELEKDVYKQKECEFFKDIFIIEDILEKRKDLSEEEKIAIGVIVHQYERCFGLKDRLPYNNYVQTLISLETFLPKLKLDFMATSYATPLEARHSDYLKTEEFNCFDLVSNFYNFKEEEE